MYIGARTGSVEKPGSIPRPLTTLTTRRLWTRSIREELNDSRGVASTVPVLLTRSA